MESSAIPQEEFSARWLLKVCPDLPSTREKEQARSVNRGSHAFCMWHNASAQGAMLCSDLSSCPDAEHSEGWTRSPSLCHSIRSSVKVNVACTLNSDAEQSIRHQGISKSSGTHQLDTSATQRHACTIGYRMVHQQPQVGSTLSCHVVRWFQSALEVKHVDKAVPHTHERSKTVLVSYLLNTSKENKVKKEC